MTEAAGPEGTIEPGPTFEQFSLIRRNTGFPKRPIKLMAGPCNTDTYSDKWLVDEELCPRSARYQRAF